MSDDGDKALAVMRRTHLLGAVVLTIAGLYWGREVLIPLTLAAFISLLLAPVVGQLERLRLGRTPSVLVVMASAIGVIVLAGWLVIAPATQLVQNFQLYRTQIAAKTTALRSSIARATGDVVNTLEAISGERPPRRSPAAAGSSAGESPAQPEEPLPPADAGPDGSAAAPVKVEVVRTRHDAFELFGKYINPLVSPLVTAGITAVLCTFFLIYREDLRDRILRLAGRARINVTTAALRDTTRRVTRFVAAQATANAAIGAIIAAGLYAMGIPNALLWGLLAGLLRFAPYVGVFLASAFPVGQALAVFEGWGHALGVLIFILAVDALCANLVEPWFYGAQIGASPTALLLSFVLWTWLWGGIGLLLATPITVCLVVLGKHTPTFEWFYIFLGSEPVLEPAMRFYQRLLAQDRVEAVRVVRAYAQDTSATQACADVVLPGLAQLECDRRRGLLDAERVESARQAVAEILDGLRPPAPEPDTAGGRTTAHNRVVAVLDRGAFDDLLPALLAHAGDLRAENWVVFTRDSLATEIVARVGEAPTRAVVFAAIEPRDMSRLRHILKRLRAEHPHVPVHLAVFSASTQRPRAAWGAAGAAVRHTLASLVSALRGPAAPRAIEGSPATNEEAVRYAASAG